MIRRADARSWLEATKTSAPARFVLLVLLVHANGSDESWPSVPALSLETGLGTTTVRRALRELERFGDLSTTARHGSSSLYRLELTPTAPVAPTPTAPAGTPTSDDQNPNGSGRRKGIESNQESRGASFLPGSGSLEWFAADENNGAPITPERTSRNVAEARKALETSRRAARGAGDE